MMDDVDLIEIFEVVLDAPTVAERKKRLSKAQHASEVKSPQHQRPSVAHCDNVAVPFVDPFSYFSSATFLLFSFRGYLNSNPNSHHQRWYKSLSNRMDCSMTDQCNVRASIALVYYCSLLRFYTDYDKARSRDRCLVENLDSSHST